MNKKQKVQLSSILTKARSELISVENKVNEQHHQIILRQFQETQKALKESAQELARARAKIRFENSMEIVSAMISDPRNYAQVVDLYKNDYFDRDRFGEFVQTVRMLERLGYEIDDHGGTVPLPNSPIITSCPNPLTLGEEYTLLGMRFGATTGEIRIEIETEPTVILPTIIDWSDTAVRFVIPTNIKIPFSAPGRLTLKRLAPIAGSGYWTDDPNTTINVVLVSKNTLLYVNSDEYSDSGQNTRAWEDYEKTITLNSPLLPVTYQLQLNSIDPAMNGLALWCRDNSDFALESGSKIELMDGPYESNNSLHVKVKIIDDWYWDYTVYAYFYIIVPEGYQVPTGWIQL